MKLLILLLSVLFFATSPLFAKGVGDLLSSTVPVQTKYNGKNFAIGYYQFGFQEYVRDEDEVPPMTIGTVNNKAKGLMVGLPSSVGNNNAVSFGILNSGIDQEQFTDKGFSYNNTYSQSGFFIGYKMTRYLSLYHNSFLELDFAYDFHFIIYDESGGYTINAHNDQYNSIKHSYTEENYGIGLKPTVAIQAKFLPLDFLSITPYLGTSTFVYIGMNDWQNDTYADLWDSEIESGMLPPSILYGLDITILAPFMKNDMLSLSALMNAFNNDDVTKQGSEVLLMYQLPF